MLHLGLRWVGSWNPSLWAKARLIGRCFHAGITLLLRMTQMVFVPYYTLLCYTILYSIILYYIILYYTTLYYILLYYTVYDVTSGLRTFICRSWAKLRCCDTANHHYIAFCWARTLASNQGFAQGFESGRGVMKTVQNMANWTTDLPSRALLQNKFEPSSVEPSLS